MIGKPLLAGEARIETLRLEIAVIDLVPARPQALDDDAVQRGVVTGLDGMGVKNEDFHALIQDTCCSPLNRKTFPVR